MLIPESVYRSVELPATKTPVFAAEIACLMCSRTVGIAVDTRWPPVSAVLFRVEGSTLFRRIPLHQLRCWECGGNTAPAEVSIRTLRREDPLDWQNEIPHRGRPPRWLVEQRRAARLCSEQQSS
jgi:hypothetical protein